MKNLYDNDRHLHRLAVLLYPKPISKEVNLIYQPNPVLEQLRAKQAHSQKQLEQLQHREHELQNRLRYLEGAEYRQRNAFDIERFLAHRLKPKPDEVYQVHTVDLSDT